MLFYCKAMLTATAKNVRCYKEQTHSEQNTDTFTGKSGAIMENGLKRGVSVGT